MGFFSKKQKVDYDVLFKEQYKSVNQITMQANNENDFVIKESLWALVVEKYDELLKLIDQGAHYEKEHFLALKQNAEKELQKVKDINQG